MTKPASLEQIFEEITLGTVGDEFGLLSVQEDLAGECVLFKLVDFDAMLISQLGKGRSIC